MFLRKNNVPFTEKVWLASPTPHPEMIRFIRKAYDDNWLSCLGENVNAVEELASRQAGTAYAVALSCCTAALHLCVKLAGEKLYGKPETGHGSLSGRRVFCSDMTFAATLNPVAYEGGIPVFIDTEASSWNMSPTALEKAFARYPDVKLVISAELYGFPGRMDEIETICEKHGALLIEDAAEAMGATVAGKPCGSFGNYSAVSYNGNKIITGSAGGCFLTDSREDAEKVRKWSTQARDNAPWYQHTELGYNYRMSNIIAGAVRGQYPYLEEHIAQKKAIYERYREGLRGLPVQMNPIADGTTPNYWLSAALIDRNAMCRQTRTDSKAEFTPEHGKTCPTEILQAIASLNAEGRPIWKPMHLQPVYGKNDFVPASDGEDVSADIFERGLCLPSDNKMTAEEQKRIIETIRMCFE